MNHLVQGDQKKLSLTFLCMKFKGGPPMRENNSFLTVCFQQKHVKIYIIFSGTPGIVLIFND